MRERKLLLSVLTSVSILPAIAGVANAQVRADQSLGTTISGSGSYVITGGTATRSNGSVQNLFHSFDDFSLAVGERAIFDLSTTSSIENIFSRVTGGRSSNINGTISIKGSSSANLFLLNPAGIFFGGNARLNLPGSFFATTGDRLTFEDGTAFSVSDRQTPSLLTVSMPTGLQMGTGAGRIEVAGNGHTLARLDQSGTPNIVAPYMQVGSARGLQVLPDKTLTLIGSGLSLEGGSLTAPSGALELGSLGPGEQVEIIEETIDYQGVNTFRDVNLQRRSLANVSGVAVQPDPLSPVRLFSADQGRLQVAGRNITVGGSSLLLSQNGFASTRSGGPIVIRVSERLLVSGSDAVGLTRSEITSETIGAGQGGNVHIFAQDVTVENGAGIISSTVSNAESGEIDVQAESRLSILGVNNQNLLLFSTLSSISTTTGDTGDVTLSAEKVVIADGGNATMTIVGSGTGGDLDVTADEVLLIGEVVSLSPVPTNISAATLGSGNAGTVTVNTRLLRIENFSRLSATSSSDGFAGDIVVNATERVDVIDATPAGEPNTAITSEVALFGVLEPLFGLPGDLVPTGDAGSVTINTPTLELRGGSEINVQNQGTGNAGTARLQASEVILGDGASITARTLSGTGGNVDLSVGDVILLRTGSSISTESSGMGNGGNITLSSPAIIALENSDIFADAITGNGGNVNITTQLLLGTAFREQRTSESDITASSEFGLSGSVTINDFVPSPVEGLVELPNQLSDDSALIAQDCASSDHNEFVVTGRGGLPENPYRSISQSPPWIDFRSIDQSSSEIDLRSLRLTNTDDTVVSSTWQEEAPVALTESTGWEVNLSGQIELVASHSASSVSSDMSTCLQS